MLKHPNSALLESNFLEERGNLSPESIILLLQELEDHCQNLLAANDRTSFKLCHCKMVGLTAQCYQKALKPAKMISVCFTPVSLLVLKLLRLLLVHLVKWDWGNTTNFLYHYQGEMMLCNNCYYAVLLFKNFKDQLNWQNIEITKNSEISVCSWFQGCF